eukprot:3358705-Pyramimonas_sp.AAC.1
MTLSATRALGVKGAVRAFCFKCSTIICERPRELAQEKGAAKKAVRAADVQAEAIELIAESDRRIVRVVMKMFAKRAMS